MTYLTLALLATPLIEAHRVPTYRNVVYSWRFSPGRHLLFDDRFNLASFRAATRKRAKSAEIVVSCDLANCYGNLSADRIASALERCGVSSWHREYLRQLQSFWQSPDGPGFRSRPMRAAFLPRRCCCRLTIACKMPEIDYIRFVDDFRLFAEDERSAHIGLELIADAASSGSLAERRTRQFSTALRRLPVLKGCNKAKSNVCIKGWPKVRVTPTKTVNCRSARSRRMPAKFVCCGVCETVRV